MYDVYLALEFASLNLSNFGQRCKRSSSIITLATQFTRFLDIVALRLLCARTYSCTYQLVQGTQEFRSTSWLSIMVLSIQSVIMRTSHQDVNHRNFWSGSGVGHRYDYSFPSFRSTRVVALSNWEHLLGAEHDGNIHI